MTYQDFANFPFVDFGVLLIMAAIAVQILRDKFTLTGGLLEFVKANKSAFDQDSDPLVIQLAHIARMEPAQMRRFLETGYLLATGEQMNIQARTKLAEGVHASPLKKDDRELWVPSNGGVVTGAPLPMRFNIETPAPLEHDPDAVG